MTSHDARIGRRSAQALFGLGLAYLGTGLAWVLSGGEPAMRPADPFLAILELLLVASAPLLVVLMAAVHGCAPPSARTCSRAALCLMTLSAGLTCSIHFVDLAVVRRLDTAALATLAPVVALPWQWPSVFFALDLLAWDVFFGLSMLFAAQAFRGDGETTVRRAMIASGALSLGGSLGPLLGDLRVQVLAIAGYAVVFPVVCLLLARVFGRSAVPAASGGP